MSTLGEELGESDKPSVQFGHGKVQIVEPGASSIFVNYTDRSRTSQRLPHGLPTPAESIAASKEVTSIPPAETCVLNNGTEDDWTVTFWSGADEGVDVTASKWNRIRALLDNQANGNWVRRDIIERANMSHRLLH